MDGSPQVVEALRTRLAVAGAVSIEELMEVALYHPSAGLYRRGVPPRGSSGGHFTTCARIDPALGRAVAGWLVRAWRETLGAPRRWHAVEVGGGDGALAEAVLAALPRRLRWTLTYHLVEIGEAAVAAGRERLGRRVAWSTSVASALREARGEALVFSNELVDAFPAALLERGRGAWHEVWLTERGGRLVEELRPAREWLSEPGAYSVACLDVPERSRAEVHRRYRDWLASWAPLLRRGAVLTIDYGDECAALHGRGGGGTLRAYFSNQRLDDRREVYHRLGLQDLTCDVNFTDLARWGEGHGWRTESLLTQREFLIEHGASPVGGSTEPGLEFVARPGGAGTAYRVLWQSALG
jgi:SAM-dependent MidA family methyltransferase